MLTVYRYIMDYLNRPKRDYANEYLSEAVDLVDLENRMKQLDRGLVPFQRMSNLQHQGRNDYARY